MLSSTRLASLLGRPRFSKRCDPIRLASQSRTLSVEALENRLVPSAIDGFLWNDSDGSTVWDPGEQGLAGWTVQLRRNGQVLSSVQTDGNGAYGFQNLTPGTYTVAEVMQSGWRSNFPGDQTGSFTITLAAGQDFAAGFGETALPNIANTQLAGIDGYKWNDKDGNGQWDPGEPGLGGWTIQLQQNGQLVYSTETVDDGNYWFMAVKPGTYTLAEVIPAKWRQTVPFYATGIETYTVTLGPGDYLAAGFGETSAVLLRELGLAKA